jgi:hypothetical protein
VKYVPALFAALLLTGVSLAHSAPYTVEKGNYKLEFPDGWAINPALPTTDSMAILFNVGQGAMVTVHGQTGMNPGSSVLYVNALVQGYTRTDSASRTLGGRTYSASSWKATAIGLDTTSRLRVYAFQEGSFLFVTWVTYKTPRGDGSVADLEKALSSLTLKVSGLGRLSRRFDAGRIRTPVDILGRVQRPLAGPAPRLPAFLLP